VSGQQRPERTPERVEAFIRAFFGPGNTLRPDQDPASVAAQNLAPFLRVLREPSDVPVVLPRRRPDRPDRLIAYVIAYDVAHATVVSELLAAFVGPTYTFFDGLPARLEPNDPVDRAVLDFAGLNTTFTLVSPTRAVEARAWQALQQMQDAVDRRPARSWHVPKPLGRLLAEFDVALAAGDNTASAVVLDQLAASGGLTGSNVAHLRIKRLARLGRDGELLRLAELSDVLAADPPAPIKDAVLAAIYARAMAEPLAVGDLDTASDKLIEDGSLVPQLLRGPLTGIGPEGLCVLALAAWIRQDDNALRRILDDPPTRALLMERVPALIIAIEERHRPQPPRVSEAQQLRDEDQIALAAETQAPTISTWPDLVSALADDRTEAKVALREEAWHDWPPPAPNDQTIADILAGLDNAQSERAWSFVGAFVDADGYRDPAPRSAHELIRNALGYNRFSPGDLAGLVALTEIVLRSAPHRDVYATLLDDLAGDCGRWVGPERANVALDLADLLVRSACPDQEARLRLAVALLAPLCAHSHRLDADLAVFARQLSAELQTGLEWPDEPEDIDTSSSLTQLPPLRVLLYSLDTAALSRASDALGQIAPSLTIHLSHDRAASTQLKQQAQHADLIVLATRCATHAATGFIRSSASDHAIVKEADGSGSASLIRAAVAGMWVAKGGR